MVFITVSAAQTLYHIRSTHTHTFVRKHAKQYTAMDVSILANNSNPFYARMSKHNGQEHQSSFENEFNAINRLRRTLTQPQTYTHIHT